MPPLTHNQLPEFRQTRREIEPETGLYRGVGWVMSIAFQLTMLILLLSSTSSALACSELVEHQRNVRIHLASEQQPSSAAPARRDTTIATPPVPMDIAQDTSVVINHDEADSLMNDMFINGFDSLAVSDSADVLPPPLPPIVPPDSAHPIPFSPTSFRLNNREFHRHGFKDAVEMLTVAPGMYPRQTQLYGQPAYIIPPGGTARDLTVWFRGRPYNEPITGATNITTFEAEEIQIAEYEAASVRGIPTSGYLLRLVQPYIYETTPSTKIVYRQGWYGLGRADWRIAHQLSNEVAYHIGINITEFQGRFNNTVSNTSNLRIGGRRTLRGIGQLSIQWMEFRDRWYRPFDIGTSTIHRNDIDVSLSSGVPGDSLYRELGLWYVRSETGYRYGDEDGNRIGMRFEQSFNNLSGHKLLARVDMERIAARFTRRPTEIDPHADRITSGLSLTDHMKFGKLDLQGSLRAEYSTLHVTPDTVNFDDNMLAGGSVSASYSLLDSLRLFGLASSSWRYPGLDETTGYWSMRTPDRRMDVLPVPDSTYFYHGNPALKPVKTDYAGAGFEMSWPEYRQIHVQSGIRQWRDQILPYPITPNVWTRSNVETFTTLESTIYAWTPLYGPVSAAASFTYAEPLTLETPVPETFGWASLRFMDHYYWNQLRIRATITAYFWDEYQTTTYYQQAAWTYDAILNFKVFDFEAYYGTRNVLGAPYQFIPSFPNMHRDEIWGVRWVLFN